MDNPPPISTITSTLWVGGQDFDLELFSRIAGRAPSEIWRAKVSGVKNNPAFDQIAWKYKHIKRPQWSIDNAIRQILADFKEQREQIVAFAMQYHCSLHLSLILHGDATMIEYQIERGTVELLASFGCSISFAIDLD